MSMVTLKVNGKFTKSQYFMEKMMDFAHLSSLEKYGKMGVEALKAATPKDTGKTAESWIYDIKVKNGTITIEWSNTNTNDGVPIALILQYGHGTRNGGFVKGIDYINPAMKPIFDQLAESAWAEVTKV